jgi:hypothetical protein
MDPPQDGFQSSYPGGNFSAFIAGFTLNQELAALTYLGGGGDDRGYGIAADLLSNEIWVTGETTANTLNPQNDFPLTDDADHATYAGAGDAFVSRLSRDLLTLSYSTYLGGSARDYGVALAVDSTNGNMFVVGSTSSAELAGTDQYSFDSQGAGGDAFVAAFASELPGPPVTWELETVGPGEVAWDLAVDEDGDLHACYFEGNELKYAKRDADTEEWTIVTRAELDPEPDPNGDPQCPMPEAAAAWSDCSIAVTPGGSPHICFTTEPKSYVDVLRRSHVCYVGPGAGDPEQVSSDAQSITGDPLNVTGECAIEIDPAGRPTIAYSEYEYPERPKVFRLNIAVKLQPDTAWLDMPEINTPVGGSVDSGLYPGLAFNQDGIPLVTFQTAKDEASIFVPSFYPPANESVKPSWSSVELGARAGARLEYYPRSGDYDIFLLSRFELRGGLLASPIHFEFDLQPHLADHIALRSNAEPESFILEFPTEYENLDLVMVNGNEFIGIRSNDANWVHYRGPTRKASDPVGHSLDVKPSYVSAALAVESRVTEPIQAGLEDCALAVGGAEDTLYALCAQDTELTLATRYVASEGVLTISPMRWVFNSGRWDPDQTDDWRVFVLGNAGDAPIDVREIRLEVETPENWELDESCSENGSALGELEPISATTVCVLYTGSAPGSPNAELVVVRGRRVGCGRRSSSSCRMVSSLPLHHLGPQIVRGTSLSLSSKGAGRSQTSLPKVCRYPLANGTGRGASTVFE